MAAFACNRSLAASFLRADTASAACVCILGGVSTISCHWPVVPLYLICPTYTPRAGAPASWTGPVFLMHNTYGDVELCSASV